MSNLLKEFILSLHLIILWEEDYEESNPINDIFNITYHFILDSCWMFMRAEEPLWEEKVFEFGRYSGYSKPIYDRCARAGLFRLPGGG